MVLRTVLIFPTGAFLVPFRSNRDRLNVLQALTLSLLMGGRMTRSCGFAWYATHLIVMNPIDGSEWMNVFNIYRGCVELSVDVREKVDSFKWACRHGFIPYGRVTSVLSQLGDKDSS